MSVLFKPTRIRRLQLPSCLSVAPMTRARSSGDDGVPTDKVTTYDGPRVGAGLNISEGVFLVAMGKGCPDAPVLRGYSGPRSEP
ncbi:UNVERIFIED_ORG: 2,4-dienoyl-CoA reductase-like NADH-dependent reductase (Old Yellow Enzyme family) [Xanthobacter viscosus]|uniref:Uncharacterized protein n=1 Tax=Xanthobacter autotrophicus TaxID=280 RepID=A0A6C1KBD4_XANAU|nr:hypothetical protein [Xanthobacter autotrophicus]TLX41412.1 hypothetical protein FBQ73_18270 [Xanthobacter autotrophicus]